MSIDASKAKLEQVKTGLISRNPENPRLVFRPGELEDLLESIRVHGVQVPISVYKDGRRFVLIDGERRWRSSLKLNRPTIPALVQPKPDALENLLLMFNIHSLREQWDLLTIALKLPRVITLLVSKFEKQPTEKEISEQTGLNRSVIRRCKLLMELPEKYKKVILEELNKPKKSQRLTEDFFIEMERALKTVERAMPNSLPNKDATRQILIRKFKKEVIPNRVHFRLLAKIARADVVGYDATAAAGELRTVFADNDYSIEAAFQNSVGGAYLERDLSSKITSLAARLEEIDPAEVDENLKAQIRNLIDRLNRILAS